MLALALASSQLGYPPEHYKIIFKFMIYFCNTNSYLLNEVRLQYLNIIFIHDFLTVPSAYAFTRGTAGLGNNCDKCLLNINKSTEGKAIEEN